MQDQTALVIHATTDIGAAIALALADAGAKVMLNYLDERDKAEKLAEHIRDQQGQAMIFRADVDQEKEVISMLDVLKVYWGRMDILVNSAGLHDNTNLKLASQFLRVRQEARELLGRRVNIRPADEVGKIICISNSGIHSKGSLGIFLDVLTRKLSEDTVRVNAIWSENGNPSAAQDGNAYAIAQMAAWLVSDAAETCNGETINIAYETTVAKAWRINN